VRTATCVLAFSLLAAGLDGADWTIPAPGRQRDLSRSHAGELVERPGTLHYLAKFTAPVGPELKSRLARAGLVLQTPLSGDSGVVLASGASPGASPAIAWFAPLEPEDKAPGTLLGSGTISSALSVLGHPRSSAAELAAAARRLGLRVVSGRDSRWGARLDVAAGASPAALRSLLEEDAVFAALPAAPPRLANDRSVGTIQSGSPGGPTPIFTHGLYGEGEVIGILDTGLDVDSCFFADPSHPDFVVNTFSTGSGYGTAAGSDHRKIAAYDFLFSCDQFPAPCDRPSDPLAYDDQGHGTHVAGNAAGDNFQHLLLHDHGDGMAPGARLVVQDAGFSATAGSCGDLPGLGCAAGGVSAIFDQAYRQGARLHSDSWADDSQGSPPVNSGYSMTARDVDEFVFEHPDFLPFFVAGNMGALGPYSIPSPGNGKNVVCVGSTRNTTQDSDENLSDFSGIGPAADGRIKPDLVAPGVNISAYSDHSILTGNCNLGTGAGTSFATPTAAGAGALVREYFDRGFYPAGAATASDAFDPSAALVKAMLIASAESLQGTRLGQPVTPAPSMEQGFGRIDLSRALSFDDSPFRLFAVDRASAFSAGNLDPIVFQLTVNSAAQPLEVVLVWSDPPGVPRAYTDTSPELVDDLDLSIQDPSGGLLVGNSPLDVPAPSVSGFDHLNNVEVVTIDNPAAGSYTVSVIPHAVMADSPVGFAVVATGDLSFSTSSGLEVDTASASITGDPDGDGLVQECEILSARFFVANHDPVPSSPVTVTVSSLDPSSAVITPMPLVLPAIPPGGAVPVTFGFEAGFGGTPVACGQTVAFHVQASSSGGGGPVSADVAFRAPDAPPGCGTAPARGCAATQVLPISPPPPSISPLPR
jgi:hypothetical protein